VFAAITPPWFIADYLRVIKDGRLKLHYEGADFRFCRVAKEHGFKIYADTDTVVRHMGVT